MLRGTVVIGLLAITLAYIMVERDESGENKDYSWEEAMGYEECEENKGWEEELEADVCPKPKPLDKICEKIDCPKLEKLNISGLCGFEARKVLGANWTQTPIKISDWDRSYKAAYIRLRKYLDGANDRNEKLLLPTQMTAPVLTVREVYNLTHGHLLFYIPRAFQNDPPVPTDDNVRVVTLPEAVLYDRVLIGCGDPSENTQDLELKFEFESLENDLETQYIKFNSSTLLTAEWIPPGSSGAQRMEVTFWFQYKKDYSWEEAKGYKECKDNGGLEPEKEADMHQQLDRDGCPKPKPLDQICAEIDCPKLEKLDISGCGFEARKVFSANWAVTPIDTDILWYADWEWDRNYKAAYSRLRNYFNGRNDREEQLQMTAPVLTVRYLEEFLGEYYLTDGYLLFYIPRAFQNDPPVPFPTEYPAVWVATLPDAVLYDRAFGCGDPSENTQYQEFVLLGTTLAAQKKTFYACTALTAEWSPPALPAGSAPGAQRTEVSWSPKEIDISGSGPPRQCKEPEPLSL